MLQAGYKKEPVLRRVPLFDRRPDYGETTIGMVPALLVPVSTSPQTPALTGVITTDEPDSDAVTIPLQAGFCS